MPALKNQLTSAPAPPKAVILSEGRAATEVEGPAVAFRTSISSEALKSEGAGAFRSLSESQIPSRALAPEDTSSLNTKQNCHPERAEQAEGSAVASHDASINRNVGATSFRHFLPKGWENTALRTTQALLLAIAVCFSVGATDASSRFNDLGHRLMCTCSCAQLLGECNHVGCPESGHMRDELSAAIASGATDEQILTSFAAKYGATVLAAPTMHGFDLVAWIAPFAVFAAALLGTILLVRHWSVGRSLTPAQPSDPTMDALREKIRRETGAGIDGGI
jgi:cytochrome c-type biogenesis protein CcmH/NrfF